MSIAIVAAGLSTIADAMTLVTHVVARIQSHVRAMRRVAKMNCNNGTQPIITDDKGVIRFKANAIVAWLLRASFQPDRELPTLNTIVKKHQEGEFSDDDLAHFYELIGTSLSAYLGYEFVSAQRIADLGMNPDRYSPLGIAVDILSDVDGKVSK